MRTLTVILFSLCLPLLCKAGQDVPNVSVSDVTVLKNGDSVELNFNAAIPRKAVRSKYKLTVTPLLWSAGDTVRMEPVVVKGSNFARRERQERFLSHDTSPLYGKPAKSGQTFAYTATAPWEEWMYDWTFGAERSIEGCCSASAQGADPLAWGHIEKPVLVPVPVVSTVTPHPVVNGLHKPLALGLENQVIDFEVARTEIVPELYSNGSILKRILASVDSLMRNPATMLSKIEITGYASPEGTIEHNTQLGLNRALALKAYVQRSLPAIPDSLFVINNGVENWDGLRKMVAGLDMKYRDEILNFIDNTPLVGPDGRSRNDILKKLHDGEPYRYMLRTFYPRLRNAFYMTVYYREVSDPNADVINKAVELIRQGDYTGAEALLDGVSFDIRSCNAMGVCHMMQGSSDEAREWLLKAIAAGDTDAAANLEQLSR